jgi:hypothetical protein
MANGDRRQVEETACCASGTKGGLRLATVADIGRLVELSFLGFKDSESSDLSGLTLTSTRCTMLSLPGACPKARRKLASLSCLTLAPNKPPDRDLCKRRLELFIRITRTTGRK